MSSVSSTMLQSPNRLNLRLPAKCLQAGSNNEFKSSYWIGSIKIPCCTECISCGKVDSSIFLCSIAVKSGQVFLLSIVPSWYQDKEQLSPNRGASALPSKQVRSVAHQPQNVNATQAVQFVCEYWSQISASDSVNFLTRNAWFALVIAAQGVDGSFPHGDCVRRLRRKR